MAPDVSDYGPSPKDCSDCHDSHGVERRTDGTTYPALLRARDADDEQVFQGDEYCTACHEDRAQDTFDGMTVWTSTAHAEGLTGPASETQILCSVCHDPHGSDIAPTIVSAVYPPNAPTTATITANDRTLCLSCHLAASSTWVGSAVYATSGHGSSEETWVIPAAWASLDDSRTVGECQVCHAPMGRANEDSSSALPKMVQIQGRALCEQCHNAEGPASTDVSATVWPQSPLPDWSSLRGCCFRRHRRRRHR
jgi:predicted CXXCH cytochrome family protein